MEQVDAVNDSEVISGPSMMPEAEVSLRLALFLLRSGRVAGDVRVAIDGAQVRLGSRVVFDIHGFLASRCHGHEGEGWQGSYHVDGTEHRLLVHSAAGEGDVVATLSDGSTLLVECKKGPIAPSTSSAEYPILREAIGQVLTNAPGLGERVAVAVPHYGRLITLTAKWRTSPLVRQAGISLLTVSRDDEVFGWPADVPWAQRTHDMRQLAGDSNAVP